MQNKYVFFVVGLLSLGDADARVRLVSGASEMTQYTHVSMLKA